MRYIRLIRNSTNHRLLPGFFPWPFIAVSFPCALYFLTYPSSLAGRRPASKPAQFDDALVDALAPAREMAVALVPGGLAHHLERRLRRRERGGGARQFRMKLGIEQ